MKDENYNIDMSDVYYGSTQDKLTERLDADVYNADLITRIYNREKKLVKSMYYFHFLLKNVYLIYIYRYI